MLGWPGPPAGMSRAGRKLEQQSVVGWWQGKRQDGLLRVDALSGLPEEEGNWKNSLFHVGFGPCCKARINCPVGKGPWVPQLPYRGAALEPAACGQGGRSGDMCFPVFPVPPDGLVCGQAVMPLPDQTLSFAGLSCKSGCSPSAERGHGHIARL